MDSLFQQRFEEQIRALADGLTKKGCTKQYDKVLQRVGRLQEKYARVAQHYTIDVDKDPDSNLATKLHFERTNIKAKEYLITNDSQLVLKALQALVEFSPR